MSPKVVRKWARFGAHFVPLPSNFLVHFGPLPGSTCGSIPGHWHCLALRWPVHCLAPDSRTPAAVSPVPMYGRRRRHHHHPPARPPAGIPSHSLTHSPPSSPPLVGRKVPAHVPWKCYQVILCTHSDYGRYTSVSNGGYVCRALFAASPHTHGTWGWSAGRRSLSPGSRRRGQGCSGSV